MIGSGIGVLICVVGALLAVPALVLLLQAVAALWYRPPRANGEPVSRLTVLVPAHNEAQLLGRCIASLDAQDYPSHLYRIVVIADNCSDATAAIAEAAGTSVLRRNDPTARGKGHALRWAMDQLLESADRPDSFVVVDGDSIAHRSLLRVLAARRDAGAPVVQADYRVLEDASAPRVQLRAVAFLLFHRVRFAGRAVLGLPCSLVGNGMLLDAALLDAHPWSAFSGAEDLEYSVRLRLDGIRPVFASDARLWGPVPASRGASQIQRERWEGGRWHVARTFLPRVLKRMLVLRQWSLVDILLDLTVPPLGLLAVSAVAGTAVAGMWALLGLSSPLVVVPWLVTIGAIAGYALVGVQAAEDPKAAYRAFAFVPVFLAEKVLGFAGVLRAKPLETWIRTERPGEGS
jgi:cellulose synthase/poly-beta-1,6-N-acetylglucosamine synthase-like glycosyltransferase